ncbi:MAG TPA: ribose-phosphate pyrophosphokinase [Candidatus Ratteibacteria bacterium]|uniref:Ribose-phosphate pyrophosphokinase n=1 Tax=candidate division TA06 bacterium ADurb.Bin131 TaxID=1852827 RepID=A0A1V6C9T9_UNCT6|nr:MAG: Ribose-phosphate pyrophosphokinase [candidate division TA06 bacterium ADurb.Bin131]HOC02526.1 ribose-phosphate pyrophosphokinase [bacterium]HRS06300.1 ribose-phosphate pyrophosphokinase [Candidatus Ratteibacteria bacterium]HON05223.1 ribose-phosphate pyrophosphokinase [bacterium]HOQ82046.1 ribose-phosphate pyrophosphokinase [bacterium]
MNNCLIFTGNANRLLAERIAKYLEKPLGIMDVSRFTDGEIFVKIEENSRGKDVFIIQPTCSPVNENLMELLIILDAFRRASPRRITAVLPYYGYARQDRKDKPRVPITAKLVANLFVAAGAQRILTMDLHAAQIQGFFDIPVDHLFAAPVIINYLKSKNLKNPVIVAPDVGSVKMARSFAKRLNAPLAIVDKRRDNPGSVEAIHLIGDVSNCEAIIVDDLISTGSTVIEATRVLLENNASKVITTCTHAVFSGDAITKLVDCGLSEIVITDTIPHNNLPEKITTLSVANLLGEAIKRIHEESSVSSLFL